MTPESRRSRTILRGAAITAAALAFTGSVYFGAAVLQPSPAAQEASTDGVAVVPWDTYASDQAEVRKRLDALEATPTPSASPTDTGSPSSSPSPTSSPTPSTSPTPTPSTSPTPTPSPTQSPSPTPTTPPPTEPPPSPPEFPNAANTGVPNGTALTAYAGPMTITTAGTTIDAKTVTGSLIIRASGVKITRSNLVGNVTIDTGGTVTISDSRIDGRQFDGSTIGQRNYTLRRVNVVGGRMSAGCITSCDVQDSWLHAQYIQPGSAWHGDGFSSNGGTGMRLVHNTLACDSKPTGAGGACSAALALYGDFDAIRNVTVDRNLFVESPAGYCAYGGYDPQKPFGKQTANVVITNNTFVRGANGKCAAFGAITAVAPPGNGNVFSGNAWDDGKAL